MISFALTHQGCDQFRSRGLILTLSSVGLVRVVSFALANSFPLAIVGKGLKGARFFQRMMGVLIRRVSPQEGQFLLEAFSLAFGLYVGAAASGAIGYLFVKRASS